MPCKRTHEEMMSTNQGNSTKKSRFNIPDLRVKLMQKLPELKDSIMQLNDE